MEEPRGRDCRRREEARSPPQAGAAQERLAHAPPMDTGPSLWLIRHGETEWSKSGQHTSRTDLALTDAGREQAKRIAPLIAGVHFTSVVVSPRLRAQQTCELSGCHTVSGVAPVVDEDLAEWDYGEYEGITSAEIHERVPTWSLWTDGAPGGESPRAMSQRV